MTKIVETEEPLDQSRDQPNSNSKASSKGNLEGKSRGAERRVDRDAFDQRLFNQKYQELKSTGIRRVKNESHFNQRKMETT